MDSECGGKSSPHSSFDAIINMMMDLQGFMGNGQASQNAIVELYPITQVGPAR